MKKFNGKSGVYFVTLTNDIIVLNKIKNTYYNIITANKIFSNRFFNPKLSKDLVYIGKY